MLRKALSCLLAISLAFGFVPAAHAKESPSDPSDLHGHWAAAWLEKWAAKGFLTGYPDGTMQPDRKMTRAEFVKLVNTVFGFSGKSGETFKDVEAGAWYAEPIAAARQAGYISGYADGSFRPKEPITREQAAHMLAGLFRLSAEGEGGLSSFSDRDLVSPYAREALASLAGSGYLQGYADGTLRPRRALTRAEAVALLDRIVPLILDRAGVYGGRHPEDATAGEKLPDVLEGNVLIRADGVTLADTVVNGNVYLAAGIGDGTARLERVTVNGTVFVNGGGEHSVYLQGVKADRVVIHKKGAPVRVVVSAASRIQQLVVETSARVEASENTEIDVLHIREGADGTAIVAQGSIKRLRNEADRAELNGQSLEKGVETAVDQGQIRQPPASSGHGGTSGETGSGTPPGNGGQPGHGRPGNGNPPGNDQPGADEWTLVWADEFDGSGTNLDTNGVDLDKWGYQLGTGAQYGLIGWGNNEQQYYRAENARVEDGKLIIEARNDGYGGMPYTSARLYTEPTFAKKYGKFEARIKLPKGQGFWPAFWMMPAESKYGGWAASGEIDIMEARGRIPGEVSGAIHFGGSWPNNQHAGGTYKFEDGTDIGDFHVYGLEWEPGEIRWYVDGKLYMTLNNWYSIGQDQPAKYAYPAPFDQPFYLILNLAVGGNFDGGRVPDDDMFPAVMEVDYVRVYELTGRPYREPVEPVLEPEELPPDAKAPVNGNYIYDVNYENGFTEVAGADDALDPQYWNFVHVDAFQGQGSISVEELDGAKFAKMNITAGGNAVHAIQLIQHVPLGKGRWYQLTFDAKSSANRTMSVKFGGGENRGWTLYSEAWEVQLSDQVQTYELKFQMTKDTDILARLEFNAGLNTNPVWIGNVKVVEIEAPDLYPDTPKTPLGGNHVYNGTFDLGRMDRMTYWHFLVDDASGARATASVDESARELKVSIAAGGADAAAVRLQQPGINLLRNNEYKLTFKARASHSRTIEVVLQNKDGTRYTDPVTVSLSTTMEEKTALFTMSDPSDIDGVLAFLLGGAEGDVYIDDVVLVRTTNNIDLSGVSVFPLHNGDFASGLDLWKTYAIEGGAATFAVENGEAKISITEVADQPYKIMLNQENMAFTNGITYVLAFDARASQPRTIEAVIDDAGYRRVVSEAVDLTTEMHRFTFEFTMTRDDILSLKFLMGNINGSAALGAHDVWIDNVVLEMKDAPVKRPPYLRTDPERDQAGQPLELTFADDEAWRGAVQAIRVNGQAVSAGQYTLAAGKLTLDGELFAQAGTYRIVVSAEGYADASVTVELIVDENPLSHATFTRNLSGWRTHNQGDYEPWAGLATFAAVNGEVRATIHQVGWELWHIQFYKIGIELSPGDYMLEIDLRSDHDRTVLVELSQNNVPVVSQTFDVDGTMRTYEAVLQVPADGVYKFMIGLGRRADDPQLPVPYNVYIDNVKLTKLTGDAG